VIEVYFMFLGEKLSDVCATIFLLVTTVGDVYSRDWSDYKL